ncbi:MAG: DUF2267 domain-containing protein [Luteolibacter sp.]|jgi:uncharacterized protein (DUF2267 family)
MSDPVTRNFNASIQKSYEWIEDVRKAMGGTSRQAAYTALRGVLHALRDRLLPEEACDLAAQLPSPLRGVYFEGWSPAHKPVKMNRDEFMSRVWDEISAVAAASDPERCVAAVFEVLRRRVAAGEIDEIRGSMPKSFLDLWPELPNQPASFSRTPQ